MADGRIEFEISADNRSAVQAINNTTRALENAGREWESNASHSADSISGKLSNMFTKGAIIAAAAKVGKALVDLGKESIQLASDLQEVQNVVDVTFGASASEIESWSKSAAQNFGLTELQAKKFASTMGAMLKSTGLAGDQVVEMSETLAGLAADMASFYNLDFETAFQKLRSGISGETEPLKQLGVNLSVANLEAFALQQGLKKTYNEMSQSEQTVLRYQYLLQATSDAQGDFARTAEDSFANMSRQVETNLTAIKTKIGEILLPAIQDATGFINDMFAALTGDRETLVDKIASIDIDKEKKIAEIQEIASQAQLLTEDLANIALTIGDEDNPAVTWLNDWESAISGFKETVDGADGLPDDLSGIAKGVGGVTFDSTNIENGGNKVKEGLGIFTTALSDASGVPSELGNIASGINDVKVDGSGFIDGAGNVAESATELDRKLKTVNAESVKKTLETMAQGLSANLGGNSTKWKNLLQAISNNAKGAIDAISGDDGKTKEFLQSVADGANDLDTDYSGYWESLLTALGGNAAVAIAALSGGETAGKALITLAQGANTLDANDNGLWNALLTTLQGVDGLENVFDSNSAGNVKELAQALSNNAPEVSQADAWKNFLDALGTNAGALGALTGESAETTKEWLETLGEAAKSLSPEDANAWNTLLTSFVLGVTEGENGQGVKDSLAQNLLSLGNESEAARSGLMLLGYEADDITTAQQRWLAVCQQLVKQIPELNTIINTQTGEITGGVGAVEEFIKAWEESKIIDTRVEAIAKKINELKQAMNVDYKTNIAFTKSALVGALRAGGYSEEYINGVLAKAVETSKDEAFRNNPDRIKANMKTAGGLIGAVYGVHNWGADLIDSVLGSGTSNRLNNEAFLSNDFLDLYIDFVNALAEYDIAQEEIPQQIDELSSEMEGLAEKGADVNKMLGETDESSDAAAQSMSTLSRAADSDADAMETVKTAIENAQDAFKNLADYQEQVRSQIASTVRGIVSGFAEVETAGMRLERERAELQTKAQNEEGNYTKEEVEAFNNQLAQMSDPVSVQQMIKGLESQEKYMAEYSKYLNEARARGVSDAVLGYLSDGSQESFDYLKALATDKNADITRINELYKKVTDQSEGFTNSLTDQKLKADETYKSLVETAQEAINGLNLGDEAYNSVAATVDGIVKALGDKSAEVTTQVNGILAQIARLSESYNGSFGYGAGIIGNTVKWLFGNHANGIDYVPYDGYLALLHQGERVQTAAEADLSRRYTYQQPAFDYDAMGGAIGANISGGNVYLDGQTVGRIISNRQADSYRALERSGWQG